MQKKYVLLLVSLNPDSTDLSGLIYPESGYIESKDYLPDKDIRRGLYGTLWGKVEGDHWLNTDPQAQWRVINIKNNDEMVFLEPMYNFIKFRKGIIVCSGTKQKCSTYICSNCPQKKCDKENCQLVGMHTKNEDEPDTHILSRGANSISETDSAGCHAINTGNAGTSETKGWGSHAVTLGPKSKSIVRGDESVAFAIGTESYVVAEQDGGIAMSLSLGGNLSAGKRGCAIGLGGCTLAKAGARGFIALKYSDGKRDRLAVGYVGEGIESGVIYGVNDVGEFHPVEQK